MVAGNVYIYMRSLDDIYDLPPHLEKVGSPRPTQQRTNRLRLYKLPFLYFALLFVTLSFQKERERERERERENGTAKQRAVQERGLRYPSLSLQKQLPPSKVLFFFSLSLSLSLSLYIYIYIYIPICIRYVLFGCLENLRI